MNPTVTIDLSEYNELLACKESILNQRVVVYEYYDKWDGGFGNKFFVLKDQEEYFKTALNNFNQECINEVKKLNEIEDKIIRNISELQKQESKLEKVVTPKKPWYKL